MNEVAPVCFVAWIPTHLHPFVDCNLHFSDFATPHACDINFVKNQSDFLRGKSVDFKLIESGSTKRCRCTEVDTLLALRSRSEFARPSRPAFKRQRHQSAVDVFFARHA